MMTDTPPYVLYRRAISGDGTKEVVKRGFESRERAWDWHDRQVERGKIENTTHLHGVEPENGEGT